MPFLMLISLLIYAGPRAPSSPSTRKDSPIPRNDGSISNTTVGMSKMLQLAV